MFANSLLGTFSHGVCAQKKYCKVQEILAIDYSSYMAISCMYPTELII